VHTARVSVLLGVLIFSAALACYQQPEIPRNKPLACAAPDPAECPAGYVCIANRICAPESCRDEEDCPIGLVCTRTGCLPPGGGDGGIDAGGDS
jgi:hypothetical protein